MIQLPLQFGFSQNRNSKFLNRKVLEANFLEKHLKAINKRSANSKEETDQMAKRIKVKEPKSNYDESYAKVKKPNPTKRIKRTNKDVDN